MLVVAVSINVDRIVKLPGLADRALQALLQLLGVVVFSLLALAPGQAPATLGIELVAIAVPLALASYLLVGRALRARELSAHRDLRQLVAATGTVPFAIAGLSLIAESGGGLYWLLAGTVLALIGAVLNAWVLLVEILR